MCSRKATGYFIFVFYLGTSWLDCSNFCKVCCRNTWSVPLGSYFWSISCQRDQHKCHIWRKVLVQLQCMSLSTRPFSLDRYLVPLSTKSCWTWTFQLSTKKNHLDVHCRYWTYTRMTWRVHVLYTQKCNGLDSNNPKKSWTSLLLSLNNSDQRLWKFSKWNSVGDGK